MSSDALHPEISALPFCTLATLMPPELERCGMKPATSMEEQPSWRFALHFESFSAMQHFQSGCSLSAGLFLQTTCCGFLRPAFTESYATVSVRNKQ